MGNANAACGEPGLGQVPCFTCCDDGKGEYRRKIPHAATRTLSQPGYEVELAVSPLAGMKGAAGYHSSVLIQGEEYFFSPMGIIHSPNVSSHKRNPHMQRLFIGLSRYSGNDLVEFFDSHFPPGHYDLLRKNCNSFSDCALYFLCEQRMDLKFRTVELFGRLADDHAGIIQSISGGEYLPNPQAVGFDLEAVIAEVDAERPELDNNSATESYEPRTPGGRTPQARTPTDDDGSAIPQGPPELLDFSSVTVACNANSEDFGDFTSSVIKLSTRGSSKSQCDVETTRSGPTDPVGFTLTAPLVTSLDAKIGLETRSARVTPTAPLVTSLDSMVGLEIRSQSMHEFDNRKEPLSSRKECDHHQPLSSRKEPLSWNELRRIPPIDSPRSRSMY